MFFDNQCFIKTSLDQIITFKTPKLGPDNNSTAYIYIYVCVCVSTRGPVTRCRLLLRAAQAGLLCLAHLLWLMMRLGSNRLAESPSGRRPHLPIVTGGPFPQATALPSPPSPSLFPPPPGSFCNAPGGGGPGWCRRRAPRAPGKGGV